MIVPDKEKIGEMFREEANKVWQNLENHPISEIAVEFKDSESINDPLMSIRCGHRDYRAKAIGRVLLRNIQAVTIIIYEKALEKSEEHFKALLRHEAIHIGYPRHDEDFRRVAKEVNAPLTEFEMEGGVTEYEVQMQSKKGGKYETVFKSNSLEDAKTNFMRIVKELREKGREEGEWKRMRIHYRV